MFHTNAELNKYVTENYPDVTDNRFDQSHWDLLCTTCKLHRGFQLIKRVIAGYLTDYPSFVQDVTAPVTYIFRCPVCKAFKQWIVYEIERHYYRVTSVPSEGLEDIEELPAEPPSLRIAYKQAIRAMDANAYLAAAAMFRRALQIVTRNLLGAKPGNLVNELTEVVGKPFNGGVITNNFASVGYIVKEAGNQGAHPDKDPDLLEFTQQDAEDLQRIFMEIVSELFIIPAAKQKAKDDFLARRKITPRP